MAANSLRPYVAELIVDPIARIFIKIGISPNTLSIISLIFSIFAGIFYYFAGDNYFGLEATYYFLLVAAICLFINSGLDALDGAVARLRGIAGKKGDFLDHVIDRYADVFIISGIVFGGFVPWWIGFVALIGVLLTSYLGTQAQALDIGRYYGGIMGRADRLIILLVASILSFGYMFITGSSALYGGFSFLGWAMIIIAIGSHLTAFQRIYHIWKALGREEKAAAAATATAEPEKV